MKLVLIVALGILAFLHLTKDQDEFPKRPKKVA